MTLAVYPSDPVGPPPFNGSGVFIDFAIAPGSAVTTAAVTVCNLNAGSEADLEWWDPTANSGSGGWHPVVGNPGPTYSAGPPACASVTLDDSTSPTLSQLTGTVFGASVVTAPPPQPRKPSFTSAAHDAVPAGAAMGYLVTTKGTPTASIGLAPGPALPAGVTLTDNGNGTATLICTQGTAPGTHTFTLQATNNRGKTTQNFVLTVGPSSGPSSPAFTSANSATAAVGSPFSFTVTTTGVPIPSIKEKGKLPKGATFRNNGDGTATLSGTPKKHATHTYQLTLTATSGKGKAKQQVTQVLMLTVTE